MEVFDVLGISAQLGRIKHWQNKYIFFNCVADASKHLQEQKAEKLLQ